MTALEATGDAYIHTNMQGDSGSVEPTKKGKSLLFQDFLTAVKICFGNDPSIVAYSRRLAEYSHTVLGNTSFIVLLLTTCHVMVCGFWVLYHGGA